MMCGDGALDSHLCKKVLSRYINQYKSTDVVDRIFMLEQNHAVNNLSILC